MPITLCISPLSSDAGGSQPRRLHSTCCIRHVPSSYLLRRRAATLDDLYSACTAWLRPDPRRQSVKSSSTPWIAEGRRHDACRGRSSRVRHPSGTAHRGRENKLAFKLTCEGWVSARMRKDRRRMKKCIVVGPRQHIVRVIDGASWPQASCRQHVGGATIIDHRPRVDTDVDQVSRHLARDSFWSPGTIRNSRHLLGTSQYVFPYYTTMWTQSVRERLASYISPEKAQQCDVEQQLKEDIAELKDILTAFCRHYNDAFPPVLRLPPELLSRIFLIASKSIESLEAGSHHPSTTVSHVCHRWRQIALAERGLWANIPFDMSRLATHTFLQRSDPMPVYLRIRAPSQLECLPAPKYFLHRAAAIIIDYVESGSDQGSDRVYYQWREDNFDKLISFVHLLTLPTPLLQRLSIDASKRRADPENRNARLFVGMSPNFNLFGGDAPLLRSISLRNTVLPASFHTLETLEFSGPSSPKEFYSFLDGCPALRSLKVRADPVYRSQSDRAPTRPVELPNLSTLEIIGETENYYNSDSSKLLNVLTAINIPSTCRIRAHFSADALPSSNPPSIFSLLSARLHDFLSSSVCSIGVGDTVARFDGIDRRSTVSISFKFWPTLATCDPAEYSIPEEKPLVELIVYSSTFQHYSFSRMHTLLPSGTRLMEIVSLGQRHQLSRQDIYYLLAPCTSLERLNMDLSVFPSVNSDSFSVISEILDSKAKAATSTITEQSPFLTNLAILDLHLREISPYEWERLDPIDSGEPPTCIRAYHTFPPFATAQQSTEPSEGDSDTGGQDLASPHKHCRRVDIHRASTLL